MSLKRIVPPVYRLTCDRDGCSRYFQSDNQWATRREAQEQDGWQVRPNGGKGSRSAPDLCPQHRAGDPVGEPCPCFLYDCDPDATGDVDVCECGHADDEHDESGACQAVAE